MTADNVPAHITIGGELDENQLKEIAGAVFREGVGPEWDAMTNGFRNTEEVIAYIQQASENGTSVDFMDDQRPNGRMDELTECLRNHDIPYVLHHDGYADLPSLIEAFRPDLGYIEPMTTESDNDGRALLSYDRLEKTWHSSGQQGIENILEQKKAFEANSMPAVSATPSLSATP